MSILTKASPYCVLALANYIKATSSLKTEIKLDDLSGSVNTARHLVRTYAPTLYGDAAVAAQVDYWLDYTSDVLFSTDFKPIVAAVRVLDNHLTLRSYMVGYSLSLADFAVWGALRGCNGFQKLVNQNKDVGLHLRRWFDFVSSLEYFKSVDPVAGESVTPVESTAKKTDQGSFDIDLKDAVMGQVITRFPPEPSGYLHIGHIKAALLNNYFARQYKGKLLLRFDDTNPSKEKVEYQESIREDLKRCEIFPDQVSYTSDHFQKIYDLAIQLIKSGKAYVDDTDQETMRAERMDGIDSKNRNMSVEETLIRFQEMKEASERGQKSCLRAKMEMQNKNKAMRDPVIYRVNLIPHHRTGNAWKMYPCYDLACPIVDSLEGVTHALRTNEYRDRNPQYEWFLKALNIRHVHMWDFSRVNFVYTLLSKRKLTWFVDQKLVTGWDDPRFPTVRGILRRGMTVEALRTFNLMQGASQKDLMMEWDKIWALNKKIIDPVSGRYTGLVSDKITKVKLNMPDLKAHTEEKALHKKNPDVGMKKTTYSTELYLEYEDAKDLAVGEEVTLMDWGNVIVSKVTSDLIEVEPNLDGDFKKTKKKLTWLSRAPPADNSNHDLVNLMLCDYDFLITKKKLEEDDDVADFVNKNSEFKIAAFGDANLRGLAQGTIIQLERKGYYIVDSPYDATKPNDPIILIFIPDGKEKNTGSKSNAATAIAKDAKSSKVEMKQKIDKIPEMYSCPNVYGSIPSSKLSEVSKMYDIAPLVDSSLVLSKSAVKDATKKREKGKDTTS